VDCLDGGEEARTVLDEVRKDKLKAALTEFGQHIQGLPWGGFMLENDEAMVK